MSLLVPNASKKTCVEMILKAQNLTLHLYTNNKVPAVGDVAADYTEATGSGYAPKTLTAGSWAVTAANPAVGTYATQTFTFTAALSPGNVYGYFVKRTSDSLLMWSERFTTPAGPYAVTSSADTIDVNPVFNEA